MEAPTMKTVFGGNLVAQMFSILLYGVLLAQCYSYFLNQVFKRDTILLRVLVIIVWMLETLHTFCVMHYVYDNTIEDFGNLDQVVAHTPWSVSLSFIINILVAGVVQGYYIRRIWILSNRAYRFGVISFSVVLVVRMAFGIGTAVYGFKLHNYVVFQTEIGPRVTVICGLASSAIIDSAITSVLVYLLSRQRTGFSSSDQIVRLLMAYIANTGILAMIISIATLITYLTMRNSSVFVGLALITAKLYSNSFLGTLNARDPLRMKAAIDPFNSAELSAMNTSIRTATQVDLHLNKEEMVPAKSDPRNVIYITKETSYQISDTV